MYCGVESALDVICFTIYPNASQVEHHKDTDSGYLDPVPPTCPPKYHNHMATRPLGQAADSRSMFLTFSRWYKDCEELAVGLILGTHDERYSLKWRLVIRRGWSLKVSMVKTALPLGVL